MTTRTWEVPHIKLSTKKTVIFIDFETTGFKPYSAARIIEYCALKVEPDKTTIFHSLAKPFMYSKNSPISIPKKIEELTQINDEMVANCKSTFHEFIRFFDFINGHICIAHNAAFEKLFVDWYCEFLKIRGNIVFRDTMPMFGKKYNIRSLSKLSKSPNAHMAFDDCVEMRRFFYECAIDKESKELMPLCKEIDIARNAKKAIFENIHNRSKE